MSTHSPLDTETSESRAVIRYFSRMFRFAEFNLKFDSSDGFLDHYVFSSGKQLFNLFVLILFLYLNAGNLNLYSCELCTLMVTSIVDRVDSCIYSKLQC